MATPHGLSNLANVCIGVPSFSTGDFTDMLNEWTPPNVLALDFDV